ncbi:MAG: hypothetical protein ABSF80_08005 [Chitinispirillaceae bacterium]|jgi:hypothetical protein
MIARGPVLLASLLLIAGCASTANRVMPGYGRMNVSTSRLGVILIKKNIQVLNADDAARDLGKGGPETAFYDFFGAEFPEAMKRSSKFQTVSFAAYADDELLQSQEHDAVPFDNGGLRSAIPSRRGFISDSLPYLCIIDYLSIGHERNMNTPVGGGSDGNFTGFFSGAESLTATANFVMWDNRKGTVAAYGTIGERMRIFDAMTKAVWVDLLKKMARAVADGMPYAR